MDDSRKTDLSTAIRVMTAWADGDTAPGFMGEQIASIIHKESVDEASSTIRLIAGLSNLCGMVLIDLEAATGITPHESLQDLARRIL